MILLIDADILCYRIGFACENESEGVARKTMSNFLTNIIEDLVMASDDDDHAVELYLTGKGNFRHDYAVTAEYKGNRKKNRKPYHLPMLRDYLVSKHGAIVTQGEETDDRIAIRATQAGDTSIIVSLDKDFDQVQGWHYNFVKKDKYYVEADEGVFNFYVQFLTGDSADNIIGVRGIGPVKAKKLLEDKTEIEMFNTCVDKLGSEERAIENGILLYLRRQDDEIWQPPRPVTTDDGQKLDTSPS
jgi:DNA polymerase-1